MLLVIKHPISLILAHDEPSSRDIVAEVVAGQVQDLGTIPSGISPNRPRVQNEPIVTRSGLPGFF